MILKSGADFFSLKSAAHSMPIKIIHKLRNLLDKVICKNVEKKFITKHTALAFNSHKGTIKNNISH